MGDNFFQVNRNLLVGDSDCKRHQVAAFLANDTSVLNKWETLSDELGLSPTDKFNLQKHAQHELNRNELFCKMLEAWRSRQSTQATLENLLNALNTLELYDCARRIVENYARVDLR